ncbi:helix-turn-helix domain-containing protein [Bombilactobacillus thymidiniphilus]|uniref:Helix-turn-helix domain-containing protein n=1 Tax=Bombilactobacillus thymidiniphilus TaxID=2923363 RepID=A0ABY4PCV7_9LACO|nr:helix-turn-helix transcriptional regulator [Bombilactobacillus thymidiniphilus]UQS83593.1 helix-turn-helix domain-containing protein [Bombilactobacillus thymidiniphilus]UQS83654.1 helix-turn-helix domain-containing protein [Bombilactobacillus thymidiniphilus]
MDLGEKIKNNRQKKHLTQEQLGQKMMVSRKTISGWENNRSLPDIKTLLELSKIFNISLDKLTEDDTAITEHYEKQEKATHRNTYIEYILYFLLIFLLIFSYLKLFGLIQQIKFVSSTMLIVLIVYLLFFTEWQRFKTKKKLVWLLIFLAGSLIFNIVIVLPDPYVLQSFSNDPVVNLGETISLLLTIIMNTLSLIAVLMLHPTINRKLSGND